MDRIALIADIHGNMPALEAVLADIAARGIETIFCLGDMVGKGPSSAEIIHILRPLCPIILQGNWEDGLAHREYASGRMQNWHQQQLGAKLRQWVGTLPYTHDFCLSGKQIRLIHATPQNLHAKFDPDMPYDEWLRMFELSKLTGFDAPDVDIVIFGHIHRPLVYNLYKHEKIVINVGSVGNPTDMPLASYVILEGVLNSERVAPFTYQFVRLPYDIERALDDARRADGFPDIDYYEFELRNGSYRGALPKYRAMVATLRAAGKI